MSTKGVSSGLQNMIQGGDFGSGFMSGSVGHITGYAGGMIGGDVGGILGSGMGGGISSALSGGDLGRGFQTGAMQYMFNRMGEGLVNAGVSFLESLVPRYGNYGGPGWTAGNGPEPTDDMDRLFSKHDSVYAQSDYKGGDKALINGLNNLSLNHSNWNRPPQSKAYSYVYRYLAEGAFISKYQIMFGSPVGGYGNAKIGY